MIRGARVVRDGQTLTVYVNRVTTLLTCFMSIAFIVGGTVGIVHGRTEAMDVFGFTLGVAFLAASLRMGFSPKPLLIVDARGISSPLMNHTSTIGWEQIADVRAGSVHTNSTVDVHVWRDIDRPEAGTKIRLHIASLSLPMRTKKLIAEVLTYRPANNRKSH